MNKEQYDTYIDELSRNAAEHYSLPFNEESWQKMEALLDEDQKKRRPVIFWWWLLPILFIGAGLWYYGQSNKLTSNKKTDLSSPAITPSSQTKSKTIARSSGPNEKQIPEVKSAKDEIAGQEEKNNQVINQSAAPKKQAGKVIINVPSKKQEIKESVDSKSNALISKKSKPLTSKELPDKNSNKWSKADESSERKYSNATIEVPKQVEETKLESAPKMLIKQDPDLQTGITSPTKKILTDTTHQTISLEKATISTIKPNSNDTGSTTISHPSPLKKSTKQSGFEFGFFAAADATTVKFKKRDKLSPAVGILIGYKLSRRWSVATGIGIAQKLYRADSIDYSNPYYLPRNSIMTDIQADCRVLEIPLNVQYLFLQKSTHSWSALAGLSNYFMLSEQYVYKFTENGVPKTTTVLFKNQNNHIFSVLNLAVAYRRNINKQFSWQLSPYLKLPLSGIGQGRVQLASVGLMGSLHFSPRK